MTVKISISLPDDIAERLAREENVSATVAEALRRRFNTERTRELLAHSGYRITDEGVREMAAEMAAAQAGMTPEVVAQGRAILESHRPPRR